MFPHELAEHLWLYSGDHVRSSGTCEGKKNKSCASCNSSPVRAIINNFELFWPGMCSALEYGEFLTRQLLTSERAVAVTAEAQAKTTEPMSNLESVFSASILPVEFFRDLVRAHSCKGFLDLAVRACLRCQSMSSGTCAILWLCAVWTAR